MTVTNPCLPAGASSRNEASSADLGDRSSARGDGQPVRRVVLDVVRGPAARRRVRATAVTVDVVDPDRARCRRASRTGAPRGPPRAGPRRRRGRRRQSNVPAQRKTGVARPAPGRVRPSSSRKKRLAAAPPAPRRPCARTVDRDARAAERLDRHGQAVMARAPGLRQLERRVRLGSRGRRDARPFSTIQPSGVGVAQLEVAVDDQVRGLGRRRRGPGRWSGRRPPGRRSRRAGRPT